MQTFTVSEEAARTAYAEAGLSNEQIEKALQGLRDARTHAGLDVVTNPADERKYGDISVFKVQGNGYRKPTMGLFKAQIPGFIEDLQAAYDAL